MTISRAASSASEMKLQSNFHCPPRRGAGVTAKGLGAAARRGSAAIYSEKLASAGRRLKQSYSIRARCNRIKRPAAINFKAAGGRTKVARGEVAGALPLPVLCQGWTFSP